MSVYRKLSGLFRGDVPCFLIYCALMAAVFWVILNACLTSSSAVLKSIRNTDAYKIDVRKNSINTLLVENRDGGIFIGFQIPKYSSTIDNIKRTLIRLNSTNNSSDLAKIKTANLISENKLKTDTKVRRIFSNTTKEYTHDIRYPLTTVFNDPYHINNENICRTEQADLSFVVLVHSSTTYFKRRSAMRETWANYKKLQRRNFRIVFLLGQPENETTQRLIRNENNLYGDIVQGRFKDSYRNLTHKGVLGLRWISEFCSQAKLVVKMDDDVFLNVFTLLNDIERNIYSNKSKEIWCSVRPKGTSIIQRGTGKWKVDDTEFKNMTHFPLTYCNGFFAIITADLIAEMYSVSKDTHFFWIDDIYLFGLLLDKIGNVKYNHLSKLSLYEQRGVDCFESKDKKCDLLVASVSIEGVMERLWNAVLDKYKDLASKYLLTI